MNRQSVGLVHDGCRLARRIFAAGVEVFNDAPYHNRLGDHSDDAHCPIAHWTAADVDIEHASQPSHPAHRRSVRWVIVSGIGPGV